MPILYILLLLVSAVAAVASTPDLRLLGGNGPFVTHESMGIDPETPDQCAINQVVLFSRHSDRYPISLQYSQYSGTVRKLQAMDDLRGPLNFIKSYQMFVNSSNAGKLTSTGPRNGKLQAHQLGERFRRKYGHLWTGRGRPLNILASKSDRVIETAKLFGKGFFAEDIDSDSTSSQYKVAEIPEVGNGINSLTPEFNCFFQYDFVSAILATQEYLDAEFPPLVRKLREYTTTKNHELDSSDVISLMSLCAFELSAAEHSQFCDIFNDTKDWEKFEYYNELLSYYAFGPKYPLTKASGSVFANATATLLKQGPEEMGPVYFNFAHDMEVLAILGSLNLFVPKEHLPKDHIPKDNPYQQGQLTPMLGHVAFERMSCKGAAYIRILVNDTPVPIPDCQSGPGSSCPLDEFERYVDKHFVDINSECGTLKLFKKPYFDLFWEYKNK